MTAAINESAPGQRPTSDGGATLPRLLPAVPEDLRAHLGRFGPPPYRGQRGALIDDIATGNAADAR